MSTTTIRRPEDLKARGAQAGALSVARVELAPEVADDFERGYGIAIARIDCTISVCPAERFRYVQVLTRSG